MYDDYLASRREPVNPALNKKLTLKERQARPNYPKKTPDIPFGVDPWVFTHGLQTGPKQPEDQSRLLSMLNQKIDALSITANPEYSMDLNSDLEIYGVLTKLRDEVKAEQAVYEKEYMKQPAQLSPSEQQARDLKNQVDTAGSKVLSTIFDPSPYADYAGMVEAQKQSAGAQRQYDALTSSPSYIGQNIKDWIFFSNQWQAAHNR